MQCTNTEQKDGSCPKELAFLSEDHEAIIEESKLTRQSTEGSFTGVEGEKSLLAELSCI